ncbi:hypothetical protein [Mucilaginibacter sp. UR6-11]|uniref:hypothetical protein n=1 Tax=Mucilaginibacter sp. UR6-11 TaxID=1435644 RepID=UPI001E45CB73|nr:hypothetical protein [Mucilaginibacter sp. UR6-11]MCC8427054.1 hypothetical protein [Mucilaginibacter sp. UR6-11]
MKHPLTFIIAVLLIGFTACQKLQDPLKSSAITNEESATMIAGSLASGSNGFASFSGDIVTSSQTLFSAGNGCGVVHVDSAAHQSMPNAATTYNFKHKITCKLNCNSNKQPDNITTNLTFSGNYNGPRLSAKQNGTANTTVAGLTTTATAYVINGTIKSIGSFKLKSDTTRAGTIAIDIAIKNLTISKTTASTSAMITGGSGTATITGNSSKGAFLFEGTITFTGFNEAILILGKDTYSLNLSTGSVAKK